MNDRVAAFALAAALLTAGACRPTLNTLPPVVKPEAPVQYYDLEVPADVEIRAVDFAPTAFTESSGAVGGAVSSSVGGRGFVKVYAVRRGTGEQLLLLYEDVARRRQPVQILRFRAGGVESSPGPSR